MMNVERLLRHAVQEKLAITICINKVRIEKCEEISWNLALTFLLITLAE